MMWLGVSYPGPQLPAAFLLSPAHVPTFLLPTPDSNLIYFLCPILVRICSLFSQMTTALPC